MNDTLNIDALILGGGIAGLWLLDSLKSAGHQCLLLENAALGEGQSVASQGIIHGGLKYMFDGIMNAPAKIISQMPDIWKSCLAGQSSPNLQNAKILSDGCFIWGANTILSRLFVFGTQIALRAKPKPVDPAQIPDALKTVSGKILKVPEPVLDTVSLVDALFQTHKNAIALYRSIESLDGNAVKINFPESSLIVRPQSIILTAGGGNEALRDIFNLPKGAMQRRPLHMVLVRGKLPMLFGHCVGGPKPRLTITSAKASNGDVVWQVGGQIAEDAVSKSPEELRLHTRSELADCLPGVDFSTAQFASYRVDRAEASTTGGHRPDDIHFLQENHIITAWPTKLALAPRLAQQILPLVGSPMQSPSTIPDNLPKPAVALPPWEKPQNWTSLK